MDHVCQAIVDYAVKQGRLDLRRVHDTPLSRDAEIKMVNNVLDTVADDSLCDRGIRLRRLRKEIYKCRRDKAESLSSFGHRFNKIALKYLNYAKIIRNSRVDLEFVWTMVENANLSDDEYRRVMFELRRRCKQVPYTPVMTVETRKMKNIESSLSSTLPSAVADLKNYINSGNELSREDLTDKLGAIEKFSKDLGQKMKSIRILDEKEFVQTEKYEFDISLSDAVLTFNDPCTISGRTMSNDRFTIHDSVSEILDEARNTSIVDRESVLTLWNKILLEKKGMIDQRTRWRFVEFLGRKGIEAKDKTMS